MKEILKQIKMQSVATPVVKESGKVLYYGGRNEFFQYLIDLYHSSSKHQALIDGKTLAIAGISDFQFNDVRKKIIKDYLVFGGCAMLIEKDLNGKIVDVQYLNYSSIRKIKDDESKVAVAFKDRWVNSKEVFKYSNNTGCKYVELPIYQENEIEKYSVYLIENIGYSNIYPVPDYIGALQYIELDYRISNYWNNSVRRGFSANFIISIPAKKQTNEERDFIEEQIASLFSGDEQAGGFLLNTFVRPEEKISVEKIDQQDIGAIFDTLNNAVQQEIFIAHRITSPMLFGVRVEGQLGGRNEMIDAWNLFKTTYVLPKRQEIDEHLFKLFGKFEIKDNDIITRDISELKGILTIDEIRQSLGYSPLSAEQKQDIEQLKMKAVELLKEAETPVLKEIKFHQVDDVVEKPTKESEARILLKFKQAIGEIELEILKWLLRDKSLIKDIRLLSGIVGISATLTKEYLQLLKDEGYIDENGLTPKGLKVVNENNDIIKKEIRYSYEWIYGFDDIDKKTSREFCKKLMAESERREREGKLWRREDIDKISERVGYDVWSMRGGWYRVKGTEISIPHCRHNWKQHIFIK